MIDFYSIKKSLEITDTYHDRLSNRFMLSEGDYDELRERVIFTACSVCKSCISGFFTGYKPEDVKARWLVYHFYRYGQCETDENRVLMSYRALSDYFGLEHRASSLKQVRNAVLMEKDPEFYLQKKKFYCRLELSEEYERLKNKLNL